MEDALRQTVKKSPQELSRSINGDAKTEVQALFRITVVLQSNKVEFKPSIAELTQTVNNISGGDRDDRRSATADDVLAEEGAASADKAKAPASMPTSRTMRTS